MTEMIERVAAAAEAQIRQYAAKSHGKVSPHARGTLSVDSEIDTRELAQAMIEAMREPTVPVVLAIERKIAERARNAPNMMGVFGDDVWEAGVSAVLSLDDAEGEPDEVMARFWRGESVTLAELTGYDEDEA